MQRLHTGKAMIALIAALICLPGCGGSSRTVYATSPASSIMPYPYFGKDINHAGIAGMHSSDGQVQWHTVVGAINWAPLIVGNTIYLCSEVKVGTPLTLSAVRRTDGAVLWQVPLPEKHSGFEDLLGADANTILVNTGAELFAFDAATGHARWQHTPSGDPMATIEGRPTSTLHLALYEERSGDNQTKLVALHADTGKLAWEHPLYVNNRPLSAGDKALFTTDQMVYIPDIDQTVVALTLADGHLLWHSQSKGVVVALSTQTVIVKQGYQPTTIAGLDITTGQARWSTPIATSLSNTVISGTVVVTTSGATVVAIDARTGDPLWHKTFGEAYTSNQMLVLDGVLFLYTPNSAAGSSPGCFSWQNCPNYLYAMHLDTGKVYWTDTTVEVSQLVQQEGIS